MSDPDPENLTDTSTFAAITQGVLFGDDVQTGLKDAAVSIILVDGTILEFQQMDSVALTATLAEKGYASMMDPDGERCTVFLHGVSAIIGGDE